MSTGDEPNDWSLERLRRKCDQAWELAGCARQDRDTKDEARWTEEAKRLQVYIGERVRAGED